MKKSYKYLHMSYKSITFVIERNEIEMDYNDINTYSYFVKPYAYGWMVYHVENGDHIMDDCYATEDAAKQVALTRNLNEAKRVADAKARIEHARKHHVIPASPYYSITGYYGD